MIRQYWQHLIWNLINNFEHTRIDAVKWNMEANVIDGRVPKMNPHVRFRAASADTAKISSEFLGQARDFDASSLGLNEATMQVIKTFCTKWAGLPERLIDKSILQPVTVFDEGLFKHFTSKVEGFATDSAENEVTATKDLSLDALEFKAKKKFILRDGTHSARRVITRPWKADAAMGDLMGFLFKWKDSIGQLIHHSRPLTMLFSECTQGQFQNLRTAKHRIEAHVQPSIASAPPGQRHVSQSPSSLAA